MRDSMAEGARFELAVPFRRLRFSRPARSAAPSPLRTVILLTIRALLATPCDRAGTFRRIDLGYGGVVGRLLFESAGGIIGFAMQ